MDKIRENLSKTYIHFYMREKTKLKWLKKIRKLYAKFYYFVEVLRRI